MGVHARIAKTPDNWDCMNLPKLRCAADPLIKNVNSQACEQLNSALRKLSIPVSGMPSDNAKHHISVFLALRNIDKNVTYLNLKRVDE